MKDKINCNIKKSIALLTASSLIMSSLATVSVKAENLDQLYKRAYDATIRVKTIAEKKGIKPSYVTGKKNDEGKVFLTVFGDGLQKYINEARQAQLELLYNYPQYANAVGTFSSIVDNYQHPIYESVIANLDAMKVAEMYVTQSRINQVRVMIENIQEDLKAGYSSAVDVYQQKYIELTLDALKKAERTKNKEDVRIAHYMVSDLVQAKYNPAVESFGLSLRPRVDKLRTKVTDLKVLSADTVEIKGEGLETFALEYITLNDNEVESIEPSKKGDSAKIKFKKSFTPNATKRVYIEITDEKKSFPLVYDYKLKSVAINNEKYKTGKSDQEIAIRINGEKEDANLDYLEDAGYKVKFTARDKDKVPVNIFKGGYNTSKTGELDEDIYAGKFEITVEITKGDDKAIVAKQVIEIEKDSSGGNEDDGKDVTIKSAYINKESYNYRRAGQKITFRINNSDKNCDLSYLTSRGYSIKFSAISDSNEAANIFEEGTTSYTGVLKDQIKVGTYTVQMQIYRNGYTTISARQTIVVTDGVSNISSIGNVLLKNDLKTEMIAMNSTTLVEGELAVIDKIQATVKGQSGIMIIPTSCVEVSTSNENVVDAYKVDDKIKIAARKSGTAVVTLKSGNVKKDLYMKVVTDGRKVSKVVPSESSVKVVVGKERKFNLLFLDQYGDPMRVSTDENIAKDKDKQVKIEIAQGSGPKVATVTPLNVTSLNEDGRYLGFGVTGSNKGSGNLIFRDSEDRVMWQGSVNVSDKDDSANIKLEFFYDSPITKNTFEVGQEAIYQVSNLNSEYMFNGLRDLSSDLEDGYLTIESQNKDIAKVDVDKNIFIVNGLKEGYADIVIKNKKEILQKLRVNIVSSTVSNIGIIKVNFVDNPTIDYSNKVITIKDVLDIVEDKGKDSLVYGIDHNKTTIFPVRIDKKGILYIDEDNNGANNSSVDIKLGKVELQNGGKDINIFTGIITAKGDNYKLQFNILVDKNKSGSYEDDEIITSTSVNVKVTN